MTVVSYLKVVEILFIILAKGKIHQANCLYFRILDILVIPEKEDLTIKSAWKEFDETTVELTCSVDRIKPSCTEMFWKINDERVNATVETKTNEDDKSLAQLIKIEYK